MPLLSSHRLLLLLLAALVCRRVQLAAAHEESGEWHCDPDSESRVSAEFRPGLITLDGHADDWEDIYGFDFPLLPALDPDQDKAYKGGKMTVKALHDGKDVFFMVQVDGDYAYSKGNGYGCPSVALMFQVGDSASYHRMGGCKESPSTCNSKSCRGYEVDIMHFAIGTAVPGRLYGGNPTDNQEGNGGDRFGHLVDLYAWNPHCRNLDGVNSAGNDSTAQNDWRGAWWHSSFTTHTGFLAEDTPYASSGKKGTYYFEFSRPLRTMDRLQQDVQFTIGQTSKFSAAFWYPADGNPWHGSAHYSISCDWVSLDVSPGSSSPVRQGGSGSSAWGAASGFALLLSFVAFCISAFVGHRVANSNKTAGFAPMDHL